MEQFADLAHTTLNGAITNSATSLVVASSSLFPSTGDFRIKIEAEVLKVTAVSGTTWTVVRAQAGTSAQSHADTTDIYAVVTKEQLDNLVVLKQNGSVVANHRQLNFIDGTNTTATVTDNSGVADIAINSSTPIYKIYSHSASTGAGTEETTATQVPDLSITFTLSATSDVIINSNIRLTKASGRTRITVFDSSTLIAPLAEGAFTGWYSNGISENNGQEVNFTTILSLASGSHTIKVMHEAALTTAQVKWLDRHLSIQVLG